MKTPMSLLLRSQQSHFVSSRKARAWGVLRDKKKTAAKVA